MRRNVVVSCLVSVVALMGTAGCGSTNGAVNPSWMKVDSANMKVTLNLEAGYNQTNGSENFNGYANGQMVVTIPVGYHVTVNYGNGAGIPMDIGVYDSNNQLAFKGAGDSISDITLNPTSGVYPGQSETLNFTVDQTGTYKIENLLTRFPEDTQTQQDTGMWDVLQVVQSGTPSIQVHS